MSRRVFVAWFEREQDLLAAARAARQAGLTIHDAYSPYAVHGIDEIIGIPPSRLPWVCFAAGLLGLSTAWALQYYTSAVSWPLNVGGKPFHSAPAFIPVAFELTVLFAALLSLGALFARERLFPGARAEALPGVTNDRFALAVAAQGARFDLDEARRMFAGLHAIEMTVMEVRR